MSAPIPVGERDHSVARSPSPVTRPAPTAAPSGNAARGETVEAYEARTTPAMSGMPLNATRNAIQAAPREVAATPSQARPPLARRPHKKDLGPTIASARTTVDACADEALVAATDRNVSALSRDEAMRAAVDFRGASSELTPPAALASVAMVVASRADLEYDKAMHVLTAHGLAKDGALDDAAVDAESAIYVDDMNQGGKVTAPIVVADAAKPGPLALALREVHTQASRVAQATMKLRIDRDQEAVAEAEGELETLDGSDEESALEQSASVVSSILAAAKDGDPVGVGTAAWTGFKTIMNGGKMRELRLQIAACSMAATETTRRLSWEVLNTSLTALETSVMAVDAAQTAEATAYEAQTGALLNQGRDADVERQREAASAAGPARRGSGRDESRAAMGAHLGLVMGAHSAANEARSAYEALAAPLASGIAKTSDAFDPRRVNTTIIGLAERGAREVLPSLSAAQASARSVTRDYTAKQARLQPAVGQIARELESVTLAPSEAPKAAPSP